MRLLTYNLQSLRGSRAGVVATIRAAAADVVCLQEVPRFAVPALRARRLAHDCGLVAVGRGRLSGDTAVFVAPTVAVQEVVRVALSRTPGLHRRGVTIAALTVGGLDVTVASVHLGLDAAERLRHADEIVQALTRFQDSWVVAGDVNEGPEGAAWQLLADRVGAAVNTDRATFPSSGPTQCIDTMFIGGTLTSTAVDTCDSTASDHVALVVDCVTA